MPHQILGLMPELNVYTFARTTDPILGDTGMKLIADYDLDSVPQPDILVVGGDFAFTLIRELLGPQAAAAAELAFQYDPQPPMGTGSPEKAPPELVEYVRQWVAPMQEGLAEFVAKATGRPPSA